MLASSAAAKKISTLKEINMSFVPSESQVSFCSGMGSGWRC